VLQRTFGDLRSVQGVLWPYNEERQVDGQRTLALKVSRVRINAGVSPTVFYRVIPKASTTTTHPRR
jgi:hypothetical protein